MNPLEFLEKAIIDFAFRNYGDKASSAEQSSGVGDSYYLEGMTPNQLEIMRRHPKGLDSPGVREDLLWNYKRTGEKPPAWVDRPRRGYIYE